MLRPLLARAWVEVAVLAGETPGCTTPPPMRCA